MKNSPYSKVLLPEQTQNSVGGSVNIQRSSSTRTSFVLVLQQTSWGKKDCKGRLWKLKTIWGERQVVPFRRNWEAAAQGRFMHWCPQSLITSTVHSEAMLVLVSSWLSLFMRNYLLQFPVVIFSCCSASTYVNYVHFSIFHLPCCFILFSVKNFAQDWKC